MLRQRDARWSNPKVLAIFALIFFGGAAFGGAITARYFHSRTLIRPVVAIDGAQRYGMDRLRRELNLTPEQERTVTKELDDYAKYYQNIEEEREDVAEHGRQRILSVLTDDQKQRFNAIFTPKRR